MFKPVLMVALMATAFAAHAANEDDLAAIRAQIADLKKNYEQRIAALEQRLADSEARVAAVQKPTAMTDVGPATAVPASAASAFNPEVSLILQGQFARAKDNQGRTITGFVPASPTDGERTRGFSVDSTELVLAANIDPYWRGQAIVAMQGGQAEIEEAWAQSLGLGQGLGLKLGRFRSSIGYLNEQHPHMWDFADAPLAYRAMFGGEGAYLQDGVQARWLAPTDTFVEFGAEFGRGAAFPGTDRNKNGNGAGAVFAHLGGDVGVAHQWRLGASYLSTRAGEREAIFTDRGNGGDALGRFSGESNTFIADLVWKWAPDGNPKYRNFKFQTEYFQRREKGDLTCASADAASLSACDGLTDAYRSRQSGWYAQAVYQFTPNWRAGLRYEQLDSGTRDLGGNAAYLLANAYKPKKATAMIDYSWSEFSRMRLQLAQDQSVQGLTDNQLILQYIMSLGAHGAHKF